jgi:Na+-driven multidrug efflux pump
MIMVSSLGSEAIAAVGITTQPKFLLMAFVFAINTGVTVIVSRRKGANDAASANLALRNGLILTVIIASLASVLSYIFAEPFLMFAGANVSYIDTAVCISALW